MRFINLTLVLLLSLAATAQAPDSVTLDQCQQWAKEHHPLSQKPGLLDSISGLKQENIAHQNLPKLSLNAQATYQSDVTQVNVDFPGIDIPAPSNDQYRVTLDVQQNIYNGGVSQKQQRIEQAGLNVQKQEVDVQLYQIREKVNQLYFGILLMQEKRTLLETTYDALETKLKDVNSAIKNGVALPSARNVIRVEMMKLEQQKLETEADRNTWIGMMEKLTGKQLGAEATFIAPATINLNYTQALQRPELSLFGYQKQLTDQKMETVGLQLQPKVAAFATGGYGRPGLNMLSDEFEPYFIGGVKFSWNLWDWGSSQNEKQQLQINQRLIDQQREVFELNNSLELEQQRSEITKLEKLIEKDNEIIALRKEIVATASSQLDNGVITPTNYITERNALTQAQLNKELHKVQLQKAKVEYQYILGSE